MKNRKKDSIDSNIKIKKSLYNKINKIRLKMFEESANTFLIF